MVTLFFGVIAATMLLSAGQAAAQTVVLVRHGEKLSAPADDPGLTAAGRARAEALADSLRDTGVDLILTSGLRRTVETAAPLAQSTGLQPETVGLGTSIDSHVSDIVARIRTTPRDATIVVVGHSNTLPAIAKAIGAVQPVSLRDCDYDKLFVVQLGGDRPTVVAARYGEPSQNCSD